MELAGAWRGGYGWRSDGFGGGDVLLPGMRRGAFAPRGRGRYEASANAGFLPGRLAALLEDHAEQVPRNHAAVTDVGQFHHAVFVIADGEAADGDRH